VCVGVCVCVCVFVCVCGVCVCVCLCLCLLSERTQSFAQYVGGINLPSTTCFVKFNYLILSSGRIAGFFHQVESPDSIIR
jgi:hypothetical protein